MTGYGNIVSHDLLSTNKNRKHFGAYFVNKTDANAQKPSIEDKSTSICKDFVVVNFQKPFLCQQ